MAVSTDPRPPHQWIDDQLAAARNRLLQPELSHAELTAAVNRIFNLGRQAAHLGI